MQVLGASQSYDSPRFSTVPRLEDGEGGAAIGEFRRDDLALFGHAHAAFDGADRLGGEAWQRRKSKMKERIRTQIGITASVGIAGSKSTAKVASDHSKPDGLVEVPPGGDIVFLHKIIPGGSDLSAVSDDPLEGLSDDVSKAKIKSAFKKSTGGKVKNKVVLTKFIDLITS